MNDADVINIVTAEPGVLLNVLLNVLPFLFILLSAYAVYLVVKHLRKKRKRDE